MVIAKVKSTTMMLLPKNKGIHSALPVIFRVQLIPARQLNFGCYENIFLVKVTQKSKYVAKRHIASLTSLLRA